MPAPVITPSLATYRATTAPLPQPYPQFTADQSVKWTTTAGALLTTVSPRVLYVPNTLQTGVFVEAPNERRVITVTGTNAASQSGSVAVQIEATLPFGPAWRYPFEEEPQADTSFADDKRYSKTRYNGPDLKRWSMGYEARQNANWTELRAFLLYHALDIPFYIDDPETGVLEKVKRISGFKTEPGQVNLKDFSFVIQSAA